jgi:filamentous hemagglutinin family protein
MMQSRKQKNGSLKAVSWLIATGVFVDCVLGFGGLEKRAIAQSVVPDGSTPTNIIPPARNCDFGCIIRGGTHTGGNVFHSFERFNVPNDRTIHFDAGGAENIFSRVTGRGAGFRSYINGILSADANLFLLNPNGILFGPKAQLDIRGSFLATTADRFVFGSESFSAIDPQPVSPLLTVNVPIGLQYGTAGAITSDGSNLAVDPGQSLILAGGSVTLNGGSLTAPGGRIELGAATSGSIDLNRTGSIFSLDFSNVAARGDVTLENSDASVTSSNGGSIAVNGRHITLTARSSLDAGIAPRAGSTGSQAGDIVLDALGRVELLSSEINNRVNRESIGDAGDIVINAQSVFLREDSVLNATTFGAGNPGNIVITAQDVAEFDGTIGGAVFSTIEPGAIADSPIPSNITITANQIFIKNGFEVQTLTATRGQPDPGQGDAGNIVLIAQDSVTLENDGDVFSNIQSGARGNGGNIEIRAGSLFIKNSSGLEASTRGIGNAGDVIVEVRGTVELADNSIIYSNVAEGGIATESSIISITANEIIIKNYSEIQALTEFREHSNPPGRGNAGDIFLIAPGGSITLENEALVTSLVQPTVIGNSGDIHVKTGSLFISGRSELEALTRGNGNAGNVTVEASERIVIDGRGGDPHSFEVTGIQSRVTDQATGNGGVITIRTGELSMAHDTALLVVKTDGNGNAGTINIVDTDRVIVRDGAEISAETTTAFNAGDVTISANELVQVSGIDSRITAETSNQGSAGRVEITTGRLLVENQGSVAVSSNLADLFAGGTGNLNVNADSIRLVNEGSLEATTNANQGGEIRLRINDSLVLNNNSQITAEASLGNGGRIIFQRSGGDIRMQSDSEISAAAENGNGGIIRFRRLRGDMRVLSNSSITVDAGLRGGRIDLPQADNLQVSESDITADAGRRGGNIRFRGVENNLQVLSGSEISAISARRGGNIRFNRVDGNLQIESDTVITTDATLADGNDVTRRGGNINFPRIAGNLEVSNSEIRSNAERGGNIRFQPIEGFVRMQEGSKISANASSSQGGNIAFDRVDGDFQIQTDSRITANSERTGGNIDLRIDGNLSVETNGEIRAEATGQGGNLNISANSLFLTNGGRLSTRTSSDVGGNIDVRLQDSLVMRFASEITTEGLNQGDGGNINIEAPDGLVRAILSENSDIFAGADEGDGGEARATAIGVFGFRLPDDGRTPESDFTASSVVGIDGATVLETEEKLPEELPESVFEPRITRNCQAIANPNQSEFTITGRGGLPPNAEEAIATDNVQVDLVSPGVPELSGDRTPNSELQPLNAAIPNQIIEAQGWVVGENGDIQLVAAAPQVEPQSPAFTPVNCALLGAVE